MITQSYLKEIFDYKDGNLFWKVKKSNSVKVGDVVGSKNNLGYIQTNLNGSRHKVHRLIWMWHYGFLPQYIDHIDLNKQNNKIENLRVASNSENLRNRTKQLNNTSGFKGVTLHKSSNKFQAQIKINGKQIYLGLHESAKDAHDVYCVFAKKYHGDFWKA